MAKRTGPPRKVVRTAPASSEQPRVRRGPPPPSKPITGRILAVLLGAMFIAAVLLIAVKAFEATGHPGLGLAIGIACVLASALIFWRTSRSSKTPR